MSKPNIFTVYKNAPNSVVSLPSPANRAHPYIRVVPLPSTSAQPPIVVHNWQNRSPVNSGIPLPGKIGDAAAGLMKLHRPEHHEDTLYNKLNDKVDKLSDKLDDIKTLLVSALAMLAEISQKMDNNNEAAADPLFLEVIKTKEELFAFEESLTDQQKFRSVVIFLKTKYSAPSHISVSHMLSALLSPVMSEFFTFAGTKDKQAFNGMKRIKSAVVAAHDNKITDEVYKDGCKLFFKTTSAAHKTSAQS